MMHNLVGANFNHSDLSDSTFGSNYWVDEINMTAELQLPPSFDQTILKGVRFSNGILLAVFLFEGRPSVQSMFPAQTLGSDVVFTDAQWAYVMDIRTPMTDTMLCRVSSPLGGVEFVARAEGRPLFGSVMTFVGISPTSLPAAFEEELQTQGFSDRVLEWMKASAAKNAEYPRVSCPP